MATENELRLKPVVAFDVDGVIRIRKMAGFDDQLIPVEITMHRDEYPTLFHGQPRWNEQGELTYEHHFSPVAVAYLRSMIDHSEREPVWATTWQRWANSYFVEPLGLEELPVAVKAEEGDEGDGGYSYRYSSSPDWKSSKLSRQFDGRPLVWIDDNMPERPWERLDARRRPVDRALTLSYRINPFLGITEEDIEEINSWLELASTEEGQRKLRADRAAEKRRFREDRKRRERRLDREAEVREIVLQRLEERYPDPADEPFRRELAYQARHRNGLDSEAVGYLFGRYGVEEGTEELIAFLRVPRYHRSRRPSEDELDSIDLDF